MYVCVYIHTHYSPSPLRPSAPLMVHSKKFHSQQAPALPDKQRSKMFKIKSKLVLSATSL